MVKDHAGWSDDALVAAAREGDDRAYAALYTRHHGAGMRVARAYTRYDPDDVVAEAFTRILAVIRRGGGPTAGFRPYLLTAIRNVATSWGRHDPAQPDLSLDDETTPAIAGTEEQALARLQDEVTAAAYAALPDRTREVLWYSDVEAMRPREISPILGVSANGVSVMVRRARRAFRDSWVTANLATTTDATCRESLTKLGRHTRRGLTAAQETALQEHLDQCPRCSLAAIEARDLARQLTLVLVPIVAGIPAAAYALTTTGGGAGAATATGVSTIRPGRGTSSPRMVLAGAAAAAILTAAVVTVAAVGAIGAGPSSIPPEAAATLSAPATPDEASALVTPSTEPTPQLVPPSSQPEEPSTSPRPSRPRDPASTPAEAPSPPLVDLPTPSPLPLPVVVDPPTVPPVVVDPPATVEPPAAPVMFVSTTDRNLYLPTAMGSAEPGATLTFVDETAGTLGSTLADDTGSWTWTLPTSTPGSHMLRAWQTVDGATSPASIPVSYTLAPPPSATPADGSTVTADGYVLTITGEPGTMVERTLNGITVTVPLDASGAWSGTAVGAPGQNTLTLRYIDTGAGLAGPTSINHYTTE
ncbi:sigma-70 family RNA polymerase sigma factor [Cnuibacter physcomitrellae]|uniref:sigma-70 family RNA polymerase sigma factor n=1 Tax=Cnuibacter physcomitrellae TaxID=1619308 RepID=UPI002175852E|nr:sigma-70 family RNA polymerase sigma factor [Cnuibacter physcomitrellae]MCS5497070.1 sigma-70 family RNA polymerase sigma factor [Cnuibacter physcomitrellae]